MGTPFKPVNMNNDWPIDHCSHKTRTRSLKDLANDAAGSARVHPGRLTFLRPCGIRDPASRIRRPKDANRCGTSSVYRRVAWWNILEVSSSLQYHILVNVALFVTGDPFAIAIIVRTTVSPGRLAVRIRSHLHGPFALHSSLMSLSAVALSIGCWPS